MRSRSFFIPAEEEPVSRPDKLAWGKRYRPILSAEAMREKRNETIVVEPHFLERDLMQTRRSSRDIKSSTGARVDQLTVSLFYARIQNPRYHAQSYEWEYIRAIDLIYQQQLLARRN